MDELGTWFDRILGAGTQVYDRVNPPPGYHIENGRLVADSPLTQYGGLLLVGGLVLLAFLLMKR